MYPCLLQGRAVEGSEELGWGWASRDDMKIGKKEAAIWAERQAEVKEVRSATEFTLAQCMLLSIKGRKSQQCL